MTIELKWYTEEYLTKKYAIIEEQWTQETLKKTNGKQQDGQRYKFMLINVQWLMDSLKMSGNQKKHNWKIGEKKV